MTPVEQRALLEAGSARLAVLPRFAVRAEDAVRGTVRALGVEVLQVNVGKVCNQACKHCHVDAGPTRRESMSRETMSSCLDVLRALQEQGGTPVLDITGGAPEMNPHFRWLVREARLLGVSVMVRCNLTIITAGAAYADLPEFFAQHAVQVISSLPHFSDGWTNRQRGEHVFEKSIQALKRLNAVGYGREASGLVLDLVHNPVGAFLPGNQLQLEAEYRRELRARYEIEFNRLYTITNMPISRFLEALAKAGALEAYLEKLVAAFNPAAVSGVMCRKMLSVSWQGKLHDCDFNQMLEMPLTSGPVTTIAELAARPEMIQAIGKREIAVGQHCFGCTAGAGSSCGGATL
jgi:radical SAM/Cys-rich protein